MKDFFRVASGRSNVVLCVLVTVTIASRGVDARADDWPTYQHDNARSGVTAERLELPLVEDWVHTPRLRPQPAWPGPARDDLYNKARDLKARMVFDKAFHVAAVGDAVYYGSSADDQVHCLDAATGRPRWRCFAEAPVRFAPTVVGGRVYFGSDDGRAYCVDARDGKLLWQRSSQEKDYRLSGNGRVISVWAVRSGVAVADGVAYFAGGLFPAEGVYLNAVKATDGAAVWQSRIADRPAQGYLLASATRVYVPTGRENPLVFDRTSGKPLLAVAGAGGAYALLAGDTLIFGPGKTGQLGVVESDRSDQLASFTGNTILVDRDKFFLQSGGQIRAIDRPRYMELARQRNPLAARQQQIAKRLNELGRGAAGVEGLKLTSELAQVRADITAIDRQIQACVAWQTKCDEPLSLILAGDTLFAGGEGQVSAYRANDGKQAWTARVNGGAYGLAVANGRLLVSTDQGMIYGFRQKSKQL